MATNMTYRQCRLRDLQGARTSISAVDAMVVVRISVRVSALSVMKFEKEVIKQSQMRIQCWVLVSRTAVFYFNLALQRSELKGL